MITNEQITQMLHVIESIHSSTYYYVALVALKATIIASAYYQLVKVLQSKKRSEMVGPFVGLASSLASYLIFQLIAPFGPMPAMDILKAIPWVLCQGYLAACLDRLTTQRANKGAWLMRILLTSILTAIFIKPWAIPLTTTTIMVSIATLVGVASFTIPFPALLQALYRIYYKQAPLRFSPQTTSLVLVSSATPLLPFIGSMSTSIIAGLSMPQPLVAPLIQLFSTLLSTFILPAWLICLAIIVTTLSRAIRQESGSQQT